MGAKLSLRWRLTLIASLLLTLLCVALTLFSIYNAQCNLFGLMPFRWPMGTTMEEQAAIDENCEEKLKDVSLFSTNSFLFMGEVIILGSVLMYFLAGVALEPVKQLAEDIGHIDSDTLSTRVDAAASADELALLATSFNSLLDRLEEAFEREKRFSAAAAHELKTPLTVVKVDLDVLAMDEKPEMADMAASLAVVKKQNTRMIELVDRLMTFSAADPCTSEMVALEVLVAEVLAELAPQIAEKHLLCRQVLAPCRLMGDPIMLKQAISNLVENAVKYNELGGSLGVFLEVLGDKVVLRVEDTGIGIDGEERNQIFEPFYRVDKSRNRAVGGAGLGLAIAKEIVLKHGGSMTCTENPAGGSIFTLTLTR